MARWHLTVFSLLFGASFLAPPAAAGDPVAMVEDISGKPAGVAVMDYLSSGKVIQLGASDRLIISYFHSCTREKITGGVVTIRTDQSDVVGGTVQREKVECDGGHLHLTTEQAANSGVVVFRAPPKPGVRTAEFPIERTLYGLSPLIDLRGGGKLVIERLDEAGEKIELDLPAKELMRGKFYDCAKHEVALAPGGVYRASVKGRSVVFKIDPLAQPGEVAFAARLLQL
ncbi:MAG TPA: hypothetical protein VEJ16_07985 [Alphaproteobacteria bacterium]|nr:hypothetical protein [Alphaproteobacteria bacterium]